MAKAWFSLALILASLLVLAASGNLAGLPVLLLVATGTGWGVVQWGKLKAEGVKKR